MFSFYCDSCFPAFLGDVQLDLQLLLCQLITGKKEKKYYLLGHNNLCFFFILSQTIPQCHYRQIATFV